MTAPREIEMEMEVVVGTYEELLLAFKVHKVEDKGYELEQTFTNGSSIGCVKAVAVSRKGQLISGSSDETIRVFSLKSRKEVGSLVHHDGSITDLKFFGTSHMFSASEDGNCVIWKARKWEPLRTLRGHKDAVYSIAVHPTGKLALSVSKDKTLRMWNLITGKCAYVSNTKQVADFVKWTPDGDSYLMVFGNKIDVISVQSGDTIHSIHSEGRVLAMEFIQGSVAAVSGEGGSIDLFDMEKGDKLHSFSTDTNRVKALCCCEPPDGGSTNKWLFSASSDGSIKLWQLSNDQSKWSTKLICEKGTKFRLTCMTVYEGMTSIKEEEEDQEITKSEESVKTAKIKSEKRVHTESEDETDIKTENTSNSAPMSKKQKKRQKQKLAKGSQVLRQEDAKQKKTHQMKEITKKSKKRKMGKGASSESQTSPATVTLGKRKQYSIGNQAKRKKKQNKH